MSDRDSEARATRAINHPVAHGAPAPAADRAGAAAPNAPQPRFSLPATDGPHPLARLARYLLSPEPAHRPGHLWPRWLFLRILGLIFFSAFLSLLFEINGLIGPEGLLPAQGFLANLAQHAGWIRFWYAPSLLWLASGTPALMALCWIGLAASLLLVLNVWPRPAIAVAAVLFLSFVAVAQDFSGYQSDGMLLAAALISLFFAPPGRRPGLGRAHPPSPASLFLLLWLWFRIYFESGLAKLLSGDPEWRHFTALGAYYQNCPLPTWIGWFAQHLPRQVHVSLSFATLAMELAICWMLFMPRRLRIACFCVMTVFQVALALTANYAFINWIEGGLGLLLLDDWVLRRWGGWAQRWSWVRRLAGAPSAGGGAVAARPRRWHMALEGFTLGWIFYATLAQLLWMPWPRLPLPTAPVEWLEPFRVANQYGLFAVMTRARYEIEFQGSNDGVHWTAYPFHFKPQRLDQAPGLYAPYQPRFEWNLWFASLGPWQQYPWVLRAEGLLLKNDPAVLSLFAGNPFARAPPQQVRAVLWQYWFTDWPTWRRTGDWWRRESRGLYAPPLERTNKGIRLGAGGAAQGQPAP